MDKHSVTNNTLCHTGTNTDNEQPLVSVIVPVYNAQKYLDQALTSIENQTLTNIEILCINDGSTDNSLHIMCSHAKKDPRIKIFDKPNEGYGKTCNLGIDNAHGIWIAIVEPDDWIDCSMYEEMLEHTKVFSPVNIDIIKTPYWRVDSPDTPQERKINCSYKLSMKNCTSLFTIEQHTHLISHHPSIWSALYKRSFLNEKNIRFLPIPGAGWADNPFMIETLCQASAIAYLDKAYYYYRTESAKKTYNFYTQNPLVPLTRWIEMSNITKRLNISDPNILSALYSRGFLYISQILKVHNLQEAKIKDAIENVFTYMQPEIVTKLDNVSPALKNLYANSCGKSIPNSKIKYAFYMLKSGIYSAQNIGLKETFYLIKKSY